MNKICLAAMMIALAACTSAPELAADDHESVYRVYFLGGQSNMEGYGFAADLPLNLREPAASVLIYLGQTMEDGASGGGVGRWATLEPGFGTGFSTDGSVNVLSDRYGPELSFGHRLAEIAPSDKFAIIKYARGGSALALGASGYGSWDPDFNAEIPRNQYDNALTAIATALSIRDIDFDGRPDRLIPAGIIWMQGEADAFDNPVAVATYEANLRRMMGLLRAALRQDDLPVVIGRIKDSGDNDETRVMRYSPEIRAAQESYTGRDQCAALVTATDDFGFLPDGWHYLSADYISLGIAFADAVTGLEARCPAH